MVTPLTYLNPGEQSRVVWIASADDAKQQLLTRGITEDAVIRYAFRIPLLNLSAYGVQDSVFFLSRKQAREIFVEKL